MGGGFEVILLDTHIWIWWVNDSDKLTQRQKQFLETSQTGVAISMISCWEVTKLIENERLQLTYPIETGLSLAIGEYGISLLELTLPIILDSTRLPQPFHRDPADQLIVATARVHDIPLVTANQKILGYPYVKTISFV